LGNFLAIRRLRFARAEVFREFLDLEGRIAAGALHLLTGHREALPGFEGAYVTDKSIGLFVPFIPQD
jgi:hypothetical protein